MGRQELHLENVHHISNLADEMPDSFCVKDNVIRIKGVRIYFYDANNDDEEEVYYDVADGDVYSYGCCTKIQEYEKRENLALFYGMYARTVIGDLN